MHHSRAPRVSRAGAIATLVALVVVVLACDTPTGTARPSASLVELDFTPQPGRTAVAGSPVAPSLAPTGGDWPVGWDVGFCLLFEQAVIASELAVDIERAIDEEAMRDARALARELTGVAATTTAMIEDLEEWEGAERTLVEIAALMDLAGRAGAEYTTYLAEERRGPLRRARQLRREIAAAVPVANEVLADLVAQGVGCPGLPLELESP